jgi:FXSXX-COOH protein
VPTREAELEADVPESGARNDNNSAADLPDPAACEHQVRGLGSGLIDLQHVSLAELRVVGDSVFAHALRRLIDDVNNPEDIVAGFQSAL